MLKNKILEKLLAIILIFTLTFANFAFVTEAYASSFAESILGLTSDTGHKNIGFTAYFGTEENDEASVISDVNNEELSIGMSLSVQESGYLKDAKIAIVETEEGNGLNFEIKPQEELGEYVQSIEDNVVTLQQINSSSEDVKIQVPIEYKNESYVNENKLSKEALIAFSGIYVDNEGEEKEVSKKIYLTVNWEDSRTVKVETSAEKYIDFGAGIILQTLVKVDTQVEGNTLPTKETEVVITAPTIGDKVPNNVYVVANSTAGTNGKNVGEVVFTEENWNYNPEENKVTIKVNNEKQLVEVNEFADEYLQEADQEVVEEERYYNGTGVDEYLVTYTYMDSEIAEEAQTVNSNIEARLTTFSGVQRNENINIVTNDDDNKNHEYLLEGKIGDLVSLNIENETEEVSKAYVYANYNNNGKYEVELTSETMVNVSYTEIIETLTVEDVENTYKDKSGNVIENNDLYYKQVSVSKENFVEILGEQGEIKVMDISGTVIAVINNDSEVNEEGRVTIGFENKYPRLSFEMSKPVKEGNIVIKSIKAMSNSSVDKPTFANLESINTKTSIKAKYNYVQDKVEVGLSEITTKLLDTTTKAVLAMDRDSLSTLETNENVELRIELNNASASSDVYGHSVFEIDLPESIESFEITNSSLLYAEGLSITSAEVVDRKIVITIDGIQEGINSGVLTNGTNIVLNANIKVNLYTPAKSETMTLRYTNQEATNYDNEGVNELAINYSAPTGLVVVNSTSNYNSNGSVTASVRQGEKVDLIDIYSDAKVATMEIIVMNNNGNTVSDLAILGRIPFKGNKDIVTGDALGTTKDTKLVGALTADERIQSQFTIYYSENGEATNDLADSSNGWNPAPESFENIKSYLIVPVEENYEMQDTEILRFTYQYEIPANLSHNEKFYGTFLTYYTNNSEVAVTEEQATPDRVGLTTGEGPELSLVMSVDKNSVREGEELEVNIIASNVGECKAQDVVVKFGIPNATKYIETVVEGAEATLEENTLVIRAAELEVEKELDIKVKLEVTNISSSEKIKPKSTLEAKDFGTVLTAEADEIGVEQAEIEVTQNNRLDIETEADVYDVGKSVEFRIFATNLTDEVLKNVVITEELPKELIFKSASIIGYAEDGITSVEVGQGTFDEETRVVTWNVEEVKSNVMVMLKVETADLEENTTYASATTVVKVKADGTATYESNKLTTRIGKPVLTVTQTTENTDTYIKEGEKIKYIFTIKNEGKTVARHVNLTEIIPEGIVVEKVNYVVNGIPVTKRVTSNEEIIISASIGAGSQLVATVSAVAAGLNGVQERTITNYGTVEADNIEEIQSNSITHIVELSDKNAAAYDETTGGTSTTTHYDGTVSSTKTNISKTYRISGTAWLDSNENGMKEDGEELLPGVSAKLVNSESGLIIKSVTTDARGEYTFSGVENGNYLIVFDYDTVKYTVTAYRKDGVEDNVNSDAVTTKLEQGGKLRNGAITDVVTVANGSVSGVNIGFVYADRFDLKLDKTITKLTVQSVNGTNTDKYENVDLAKTEIAAKYLSGSTVYVEYEMKVTNVGDVAGYAKRIIDYLPEGMTFNSSLEANSSWYTGSDGNIYSTGLSEKELAPGESATVKLVLTKQMTDENTGIVNNLAEIYEDYNIYGISDSNSTPANKAQGEDDIDGADIVIAIKTGEVFINISVIITSMLLGSIVVFIVYNHIRISKKKGGV